MKLILTPDLSDFVCLSGANGFLDFTCFVSKPRISITGANNLFIGGYISGDSNDDITVTFGRESDTGSGSELPLSSESIAHPNVYNAMQLTMPMSGGVTRIGAFYCKAQKGNIIERIPAIIMASNSKSMEVTILPQCLNVIMFNMWGMVFVGMFKNTISRLLSWLLIESHANKIR